MNTYTQFTHSLTKNAFVATITMLISLTAFSATATQLVAPQEYKPSTLINKYFGNNKISQKDNNYNPYQPLQYHTENQLVAIDTCAITLKAPRQIAGENIIIKDSRDYMTKKDIPLGGFVYSANLGTAGTSSEFQNFSVNCSDNPLPQLDNNLTSIKSMEDFRLMTGWFILGEDKITDIKTENHLTAGPFRTLDFKFNNKYYRFSFTNKNIAPEAIAKAKEESAKNPNQYGELTTIDYWKIATNSKGLFGNQIQIQFNTLVQGQSSKPDIIKPNTDVSNLKDSLDYSAPTKSTQSSSITSVVSAISSTTSSKITQNRDAQIYTSFQVIDPKKLNPNDYPEVVINNTILEVNKIDDNYISIKTGVNNVSADALFQSDNPDTTTKVTKNIKDSIINLKNGAYTKVMISGNAKVGSQLQDSVNFKFAEIAKFDIIDPISKSNQKSLNTFKDLNVNQIKTTNQYQSPEVRINNGTFKVKAFGGNEMIELVSGVEGLKVSVAKSFLPESIKVGDIIILTGSFNNISNQYQGEYTLNNLTSFKNLGQR